MRKTLINSKIILVLIAFSVLLNTKAQKSHEIKIKVNNLKDTMILLANYYADKEYLVDSAKVDAKGFFTFKGNKELDRGMYIVAGQKKNRMFDFIVNKEQTFFIKTDTINYTANMKVIGSEENQQFVDYMNFMTAKYQTGDRLNKARNRVKNNKDSAEIVQKEMDKLNSEVKNYKIDYIKKNPGNLLSKLFAMMEEINVPDPPKLPNGQIDSNFQFRYYKAHYWDNIDLSDEATVRTPAPLFYDKLKRYVHDMVLQHPDSVAKEADYLIGKTKDNKEMFKYIVFYLTNFVENSNVMGMDAALVHLGEKYYLTGKAYWMDSTHMFKFKDRIKTIKPLLLGNLAPTLSLVDTTNLKKFKELGFDTVKTSEGATKLYYDNLQLINNSSVNLYSIKAKWTILLFWDPDCGHCKTETPKVKKLYDSLKTLGIDIAVYAVMTNEKNIYTLWTKFIRDHKLNFYNVTDVAHSQNLHSRYDIYSTPVIYLLDENKVILAKRIGAENIVDFIFKNRKGNSGLQMKTNQE